MSRGNDRKNMIWNAAAGMLNAAEAVLVMAIVSRTDGIETAGVFSLAFSLANLFMSIGKYGVKEFQVINGERHFSFHDYLCHRVIFTALMIVIQCGYAAVGFARGSMSARKAWIIALVCLWYTPEVMEDVYLGKHQLEGNLYLGSQQFILRWALLLAVFCICEAVGIDTTVSCAAALAAGCAVSVRNIISTSRLYCLTSVSGRERKSDSVALKRHVGGDVSVSSQPQKHRGSGDTYIETATSDGTRAEIDTTKTENDELSSTTPEQRNPDWRHITEITRRCLPLFISYFAYFYVNNLPKYMINSYQTDEMQAIYGYLFMPVFAVPLVNSFLYQPRLLETSTYWNSGERAMFIRSVLRQYAIIAGLAVCCAAGAWLLGIPVLNMLYHADLTIYRADLILLLMGGALLSAAGYTSVMVTVIGRQDRIIICYAISIAAELCICPHLVRTMGVRGAAIGFTAAMLILAAAMIAALFTGMKKQQCAL